MNHAAESLPFQKIVKRKVDGVQIVVSTDGGETLELPRFALAGKSDSIAERSDGTVLAFAWRAKHGEVTILPTWSKQFTVPVLGRSVDIVVKEIESAAELAGYEQLTKHHYKSGPGPGRRVPLVATASDRSLPSVVGFVEVCSAFLTNTARKPLFDRPYLDRELGVRWAWWDLKTAKQFINVTARISRCVVSPELRGLGLATLLADSAAEFATERWHYGGHRPAFLEITAEMLRYWPFVRNSGFVYLGDSEGNGERLRTDIGYMLTREARGRGLPEGGGGIVSMQRTCATVVSALMRDRGWTIDQLLQVLTKTPENLGVDDWIALHAVYRRPKPVYMRGLTPDAEAHLQRFQEEKRRTIPCSNQVRPATTPSLKVAFGHVTAQCDVESSKESRQIQEAFGIVAKSTQTTVATDLKVDLAGGDTLLVSGPSGSGKSLLLRALLWHASGRRSEWRLPEDTTSDAVVQSDPLQAETWRPPEPDRSPIRLLASMGLSLDAAMRQLSSAGLAEANLFVRRAATLSAGQYYRLGLALALARNPQLLVIDEFCESLDDFTTAAVCRRLVKRVERERIILVVASATAERVCDCLSPTARLYLRPAGGYEWRDMTDKAHKDVHA